MECNRWASGLGRARSRRSEVRTTYPTDRSSAGRELQNHLLERHGSCPSGVGMLGRPANGLELHRGVNERAVLPRMPITPSAATFLHARRADQRALSGRRNFLLIYTDLFVRGHPPACYAATGAAHST